jgi:hypothetical protein
LIFQYLPSNFFIFLKNKYGIKIHHIIIIYKAVKISQKIVYHIKGKGFQGIYGNKVPIIDVNKGINNKNKINLLYLILNLILCIEFIN